eukprot:COSAG05_NODE_5437_length_1174_cov_0.545116_1_plen_39_part_10
MVQAVAPHSRTELGAGVSMGRDSNLSGGDQGGTSELLHV